MIPSAEKKFCAADLFDLDSGLKICIQLLDSDDSFDHVVAQKLLIFIKHQFNARFYNDLLKDLETNVPCKTDSIHKM